MKEYNPRTSYIVLIILLLVCMFGEAIVNYLFNF
jgi:hypothetical protein